jgi:hypothetical protein
MVFQTDFLADQVVAHRQQNSCLLRSLGADADNLQEILPSHTNELRQTAGIVFVGLVAISGQEPVSLKCFHADDIKAEFHEATVEPTAHIAGLEANLQRLILRDAVDQPASDILRPGITFALAELLAIGIDDAD